MILACFQTKVTTSARRRSVSASTSTQMLMAHRAPGSGGFQAVETASATSRLRMALASKLTAGPALRLGVLSGAMLAAFWTLNKPLWTYLGQRPLPQTPMCVAAQLGSRRVFARMTSSHHTTMNVRASKVIVQLM